MTVAPIQSASRPANPSREDFYLNGATPLENTGTDAARQRLAAIDALTDLLSLAFETSSEMQHVNPKLISSAFAGLNILNAEAAFALRTEN